MKYLAVDYGFKRIGLAGSESGLLAEPFLTLRNKGDKKNIEALGKIIRDKRVELVVVGVPLDKDGEQTPMSEHVQGFANKLSEVCGVLVAFVNERYSSQDAEYHIREKMGITKRDSIKELVDKVAACMILQNYLDAQKKEAM